MCYRLILLGLICVQVRLERMWQIAALHRRVALLEMTNHECLDKNPRRERSTCADGTPEISLRDARTFEVRPALEFSK